MELYSVIKNDGPGDVLVWKFMGEDFNNGSQLIVAESEEALFYKDGIIEEIFDGGKYTLGTRNYPFISRLRNFFSGNISAFHAKVYFINKVHKLELFWGTNTPIQMRDPVYMLQTSIQVRGSYSIQVADSKKFLLKMVGNNIQYFSHQELNNYFRDAFLQYIKDEIPRIIKASGKEILEICTEKTTISQSLTPILNNILDEYGVRLVNFYISAIDIPESDPNRVKLEEAFANKSVMGILGQDWGRQQSADILKNLANNPGAGSVVAAGAEFGMVAGGVFAGMASQKFTPITGQQQQHATHTSPPVQDDFRFAPEKATRSHSLDCPSCRATNIPDAKFCNECGTKLIVEKVQCGNCYAKIPDNAKFCNECGTKRM